MITDSFLNSCFTLLLNKNSKIRKVKALYRDILDVLKFSEGQKSFDVPLEVQNKLELLKQLCGMFLKDKIVENAIDSIMIGEKFRQHVGFIDLKINEDIKEHAFQDIINQIRLRKKINALFQNYDELSDVLDSIKEGSFDSLDNLVEDYEVTIKKLYSNLMESNRSITIESSASLDLVKDDYEHVIEMIKKKYERQNTTSTGFPIFDNNIMLGGYEPSRLYVFGGGSGAGKSTMLNNTIYKSAITIDPSNPIIKPDEINKVYIYVTLENTIEEALIRTYQPMFNKTTPQMLRELTKESFDIKKKIVSKFNKTGSTVIMKYFPAMSISVVDLMGVVDDAINDYGKESIAGLYVDYLDLLKADTGYDMYRLELGHITLSLKTLAVQYNIPVVTASQLGRAAYRIQEASQLNVDQMSESIKKVEHADFVMLMAKDQTDDTRVYGKVGKNRSGKSGVSINFQVAFDRFKFLNANLLTNVQKADSTQNAPLSFAGCEI
jgi:replicative DNA helicase